MIGSSVALSNCGCPYPGDDAVTFDRGDVVALGKFTVYGCALVRFLIRLDNGSEVFVKARDQSPAVQRWLRCVAKQLPALRPNRAQGWRTVWIEVGAR